MASDACFDGVIIIGGGVVGLTTAYALVERGVPVRLFDRGPMGQESSWAGGGILSPVPPWAYAPSIHQGVLASRRLLDDWVPRLEAISGIDCEYACSGLMLSGDPSKHDVLAQGHDWLACHQPPHRIGRRGDFDSQLSHPDWPALLLSDVPQIRNPRLCRALSETLKALGVELISHQPVRQLSQVTDGTIELWGDQGLIGRATHIVLAAGAWSDEILTQSGLIPCGLRPIRGQMLLYRVPQSERPRYIINTQEGYLIPRADGHVLAGSTAEDVGFDAIPTREAMMQIHAMAKATYPNLISDDRLVAQWTGLRPGIDSAEPHVGLWDEAWPGLYLNTGHFRNGVGLAPSSAERLAQLLTGSLLAEEKTEEVQ